MPLFSLYPQNKAKNNNNDYVQLLSTVVHFWHRSWLGWHGLNSHRFIFSQSFSWPTRNGKEPIRFLVLFLRVLPTYVATGPAQYLAILLYYSEHFNINNLPNDNIFAETNK